MFPPMKNSYDTIPESLILNTEALLPRTCVQPFCGSAFS